MSSKKRIIYIINLKKKDMTVFINFTNNNKNLMPLYSIYKDNSTPISKKERKSTTFKFPITSFNYIYKQRVFFKNNKKAYLTEDKNIYPQF